MGVLKSIRRRNQDMVRKMSSKKMLNYSQMSDGSGGTQHESKDDSAEILEAATPLFTTSIVTPASDEAEAAAPSEPVPPSPEKPMKEEQALEEKRTPAEPIGPLGVVVNEDEWDAISHISGISTRTDSSPKPNGRSMSSEEIQKDLAKMELHEAPATKVSGVKTSARTPAVVSPGPEDKKETVLNFSKDSSKASASKSNSKNRSKDNSSNSRVQNIIQGFESSTRVNVVVSDASTSETSPDNSQHMDRIVRILKRFNDKDGNESESGKVSHVFEDDQDSTSNVVVTVNTVASPAPIYSDPIPTPALVSPEETPEKKMIPTFKAVFDSDFKEEQLPHPTVQGAVSPSFDGSTATANTKNTSPKSTTDSRCGINPEQQAFSDKMQEKLSVIEETMRSSCQSIGGGEKSEFQTPPSCDSFLSSTSAIASNLKDSLQQIKRELGGLYGKAEKQAEVIQCTQALFGTEAAAPKENENEEVYPEDEDQNTTQESSFCASDTKTEESSVNKSVKTNEKEDEELLTENDEIYFTRTPTQSSF
jgi:hypothetical protein